ncbi:MAG: hypothetical protein WDZ41_04755 [Candidatus Babeliales bacterium]
MKNLQKQAVFLLTIILSCFSLTNAYTYNFLNNTGEKIFVEAWQMGVKPSKFRPSRCTERQQVLNKELNSFEAVNAKTSWFCCIDEIRINGKKIIRPGDGRSVCPSTHGQTWLIIKKKDSFDIIK